MKRKTISQIAKLLRAYWLSIVVSALLALVTVAGTLYLPVLIGNGIDLLLGKGAVDFSALEEILVRAAIVAVVAGLAQWGMGLLNNQVVFRVVRDLRRQVFAHFQQLPLSYLDRHPAGELVSRVIADADQLADGLLLGFSQLFTGVMTILFTLVLMLRIRWQVALVVIVLTPLSLFVAQFIGKKTFRLFGQRSKTRGEQTALTDELITNQKVVQAFGHEEQSLEDFDEVNERLRACSLKAIFYSSLVNPTTRFVYNIVYALVALVGALTVLHNPMFTVGSLSCLLSYANQYTKPFNEISGVITELQNAFACAERVFAVLEEPGEIPEQPNALAQVRGQVDLRDVSFSYTPERPLIEHLNLHVQPGQRVAIVGPTGCGKTTLINLLMRFYDTSDGSVCIDGTDIRCLRRQNVRGSYGMVLQDTWLRSDTVWENLSMGRPDATREEMIEAAKACHADGFIRRLPQGYDTLLSEDGGSLSQGQKQLLCIARVMLCNRPMQILDEATSSIDIRTEQQIQAAFADMMHGKTSFVVAHRLSTIQNADVILVMNNGKVIEQGTHETLLKQNGFYAKLYHSQFES